MTPVDSDSTTGVGLRHRCGQEVEPSVCHCLSRGDEHGGSVAQTVSGLGGNGKNFDLYLKELGEFGK